MVCYQWIGNHIASALYFSWHTTNTRGNLGSKMGLIRKQANNKFLWVGIQEPIEFQSNESTIMVDLTYLSLKKTTFFVCIFDISHCVYTQIPSGRAHWMQNLILHPMSTHNAYFWQTPLPQKQEIPEKMWWWHHHHIFSGISCFWGSGVHQKYAVWVLVGCRIKFRIQRALPIEIWVKT